MPISSKRALQTHGNDQVKPILIAEPRHRTVAAGISSGVSLRQFPKSTVEKVREICVHYVEKCSGKYTNNKVAARYVYQMAEEVINQLAGVAAQIRSARENQPDNFQDLLDEWNENFPKSSNFYGSPKSVSATLERQSLEIDDLRHKLKSEMCSREEEISQIMMSVNMQLNASCRSVMTERHQATLTQLHNDARHKKLIAEAKAEFDLAKSSNSDSYDITLMKMQSKNAELGHEAKKSNAALEAKMSAQQLAHDCELKCATKLHQIEHDKFANQISQLEKKLKARKSSRSAIIEMENSRVPYPSKSNVSHTLQYEGVTPAKVEEKSYSAIMMDNVNMMRTIDTLNNQVQSAQLEQELYERRMSDLESINEALRRALSLRLYNRVDDSGVLALSNLHCSCEDHPNRLEFVKAFLKRIQSALEIF